MVEDDRAMTRRRKALSYPERVWRKLILIDMSDWDERQKMRRAIYRVHRHGQREMRERVLKELPVWATAARNAIRTLKVR